MSNDFDLHKNMCDLSEDLLDFAEVWMKQHRVPAEYVDSLVTTCITTLFYSGLSELDEPGRAQMISYVKEGCRIIDAKTKG